MLTRRRLARLGLSLVLVVGVGLCVAPSGVASFPGRNGVLAGGGVHAVVSVYPSGDGVRRLSPRSPSGLGALGFSPNGRRLLVQGWHDDTLGLFTVAWNGGALRTVAEWWNTAASWAPDGRRILSSTVDPATGHSQLVVMRRRGTHLRALATFGPDVVVQGSVAPEWSPTGDRIAFIATDGESQPDVWTVRPDGTGLRRLTYTPRTVDYSLEKYGLDWSPDGRVLVFTTKELVAPGTTTTWVVTMNADGRNARRIARGEAGPFSPDGRWLLLRDRHGDYQLLNRASGAHRPVVLPSGVRVGLGAWQPWPGTRRGGVTLDVSIVPRREPDAGIWIRGSILPRRAPGTAAGERVVSRLYHREHGRWRLVLTRPMVTNRNGRYRAWLGGAMRGTCRVEVVYAGDPDYLRARERTAFDCRRAS